MKFEQTRPSNGVWGVAFIFAILLIAGWTTFYFLVVLPPKKLKRNKSVARHTAAQLRTAIQTFHTEYESYPISAPPASEQHSILSDHSLIDPLIASDKQIQPDGLNPRDIVFLSSRRAIGDASTGFRKGIRFDDADGSGELFDPWGNYYRVRLDLDGNGRVSDPESSSADQTVPQTVLVWSPGPDGKDSTTEDNIVTW